MSDLFELGPAVPFQGVVADGGMARTLGEAFARRAAKTPDHAASFQKVRGQWQRLSWRDLYLRSARAARGMVDRGLAIGDRIAIVGPTYIDWTVYDLGGHLAGLCTLGIYPRQTVEQMRYLLAHSESRLVFVADDEEMQTAIESIRDLEHVLGIVPWSEELHERWREREPRLIPPGAFAGEPLDEAGVAARQALIGSEETAILVYTSGTTGPPKGAMISHANILHLLSIIGDVVSFRQDDLLFSFLPMAHVTERVLGFYGRIETGVAAAYATSLGSILQEAPEVRPTVFGSVPRIFEKLYAGVQSNVAQAPALRRAIFHWADANGRAKVRRELAGQSVGTWLAFKAGLADRLVFSKIRALLGGRVRLCLTGAAPIAYDILEFLWAAGMPIVEAYGMTEATVLTHINRPGRAKLGTVGPAVPHLECKIAADGEILMRGPLIFKGYYKQPEATAEAVVDGWLHTGDIGTMDADGFLRITDRKKHLIITAGGKNVAPANIERAIKMQSPLISQVHAHGDRRPYISALIAPSPLETLTWGVEHGCLPIEEADACKRELMANPTARTAALNAAMAKVVADRRFQELYRDAVRRGNRDLARVERVRRYFVLDRDFSVETGEMTPTMKMKRKAIEEMYADRFERVYRDDDFAIEAEKADGG
jgi:long-chain acyl-CoA synthetase